MNDKQQILTALWEEFDHWEALLANLSEEQIAAPHYKYNKSVQDVVAHLNAWQELSIARLEASLHDREPEFHKWPDCLDPESREGVDQINVWIYETYHDESWSSIHQSWRVGFQRFLELGEAIPEKDMFVPGRYTWLEAYPLSAILLGSYEHHQEHFEPLYAWHQEHGY